MNSTRNRLARACMVIALALNFTIASAQALNVIRVPLSVDSAPVTVPEAMPEGVPSLVASEAVIDFGNQTYQTRSSLRTWTVHNRGTAPVELVALSVDKPLVYTVESTNCQDLLAPGASCDVSAEFYPKSLGPVQASVFVETSDGTTMNVSVLRGTGVQGISSLTGPLLISPAELGVASEPAEYTLKNIGTGVLGITSITTTNQSVFQIEGTTCGARLEPGQQCSVNVTATLASDAQQSGLLRVFATGTLKSSNSIQLVAKMPPPASLALSTAVLPAAKVNTDYATFDFLPLLSISGQAAQPTTEVAWSITSGSLPAGMSIANGMLFGRPTEVTSAEGSSFTLAATYQNNTGQQVYTIVVNDVTLQVVQISAGTAHTCAVTTAGGIKCWGDNYYGQLGDGTKYGRRTPVDVIGLTSGVAEVSVGDGHTCAVTTAGAAKCWGYSGSGGALGNGTNVASSTPVDVIGLSSGVSAVAAGGSFSCALLSTGGVKCWGSNVGGRLGDGTTTSRMSPVDVVGLSSGVTQLSTGGTHTCVVTDAGGMKCWGTNTNGRLGDGTTTHRSTPVDVAGLASSTASISLGFSHSCAVTTSGAALCWGLNTSGQLGDGTTTQRTSPTAVSGLSSGVLEVSSGAGHSCARMDTGAVRCWGSNLSSQLGVGYGSTTYSQSLPVAGLESGVVSIDAGAAHTCAITSNRAAKCWGANGSGQLGIGTTGTTGTPTAIVE